MQNEPNTNLPPAPQPAERKAPPNPFDELVFGLRYHLLTREAPEPAADLAQDPAYGNYIDAQILAQQAAIIQTCDISLLVDKDDYRAAGIMQRSLNALERTRARIIRSQQADARQVLLENKSSPETSQPDRHEARKFLETELAQGERPAKEIISLARTLGISSRTLERAKAELNISSLQRVNAERVHTWVWALPASSSVSTPVPSAQCLVPAPSIPA